MPYLYTYSEARNRLAEVLRRVDMNGEALIKRKDGRLYKVIPIREKESPLDVETVDLGVSTDEIVEIVRELREKY